MYKLLLATTAIVATAVPAFARESDQEQLSRIEQRINIIERKLFNSATASNEGRMMADFEARLQQVEDEGRKLYGGVEELSHAVSDLADKFQRVAEDLSMRLDDLEKAITKGAINPAVPGATVEKSAVESKEEKAVPTHEVKEANVDIPADLSPEMHYKRAYEKVSVAAYPEAIAWFKEFLARHPDHKYADNAYYWLGEVYLVEDDPKNAVIAFSTGIKKFPQGAKASANLLKMGVAFKRMNQMKHAESSWNKLVNDFPTSPEAEKAKTYLENLAKE